MTSATPASDRRWPPRFDWRHLGLALLLVAIGMRVNNALRYRTRLGFDAVENVEYIRLLMSSWTLPAPDAAWSTSHPPLFYYLSAAVGRLLDLFSRAYWVIDAVPLMASAFGIVTALLAVALVRRVDPSDTRRAVLAGALLLFLPVNIYMSAMVNEEMLAAMLISLVTLGAVRRSASEPHHESPRPLLEAAGLGAIAGLALLTKLSGLLVAGALAGTWLLDGLRRGEWRRTTARVGVMLSVTLLVGGWFYLRNLVEYGYLYPQDLSLHAMMFEMPPGERGLTDYLRIPLATWTDPQLLNPDLLHSVWGGTYTTLWFDGHRHFLAHSVAVAQTGSALLLLGLLPSIAFAVGLWRGLRRSLRDPAGPDTMLLLLVLFTLLGYVVFTYSNPWYATLKGSYLLGLSLPFAFYTSEVLASWAAIPRTPRWALWGILLALLLVVTVTFTIGPVFTKLDGPGLPWQSVVPAR